MTFNHISRLNVKVITDLIFVQNLFSRLFALSTLYSMTSKMHFVQMSSIKEIKLNGQNKGPIQWSFLVLFKTVQS